MEIKTLSAELAEKHFETLTEFYYKNSKACSSMESFVLEDAEVKIEFMIAHIRDNTAIVFGAFDNDELVGYLWAYRIKFRDEDRVYVSEIHVAEKCRGQGLGHLLLNAVEEESRKIGEVTALYIHTEAGNAGAIRLYESEGYRMERVQMRKALR